MPSRLWGRALGCLRLWTYIKMGNTATVLAYAIVEQKKKYRIAILAMVLRVVVAAAPGNGKRKRTLLMGNVVAKRIFIEFGAGLNIGV